MALSLEYCSTCSRLLEIELPDAPDSNKATHNPICPVCKNPIYACETNSLIGSIASPKTKNNN